MDLIFELSDVFYTGSDEIISPKDESHFIGEVITNRIAGIVYVNLQKTKSSFSREVDNALVAIYHDYVDRAKKFKSNISYLSHIFRDVNFKYALLKGALLTTTLYQEGQRISNDIDILVNKEDVSSLQKILRDNGFVQGWYSRKQKKIKIASRMEIIHASMNFGETVPFIKLIENEPLAIDINFSFDFKTSKKEMVSKFLDDSIFINNGEFSFSTLDYIDFFIHLCCHLYKEATTFHWVDVRKDLTLYKFSDINLFLHKFGNKDFFDKLVLRIKQFAVEQECYYTMINSLLIYPKMESIEGFQNSIQLIKPLNLYFMKQIIHPVENKLFKYNMSFTDWYFCKNRVAYLEEIKNEKLNI
ncbi:MAG: nucleotidyltransferase family protein [Defluviitaleaceae bacterium]|nr:nucleotidyltransferase family protein [Defluviitaleaceae bacterium]